MPERQAPHLVDATMFWNASGGVHRYLRAKQQWLQHHTAWRHTVASPVSAGAGMLTLPSMPLPGSGGDYRLPWRRSALGRILRQAGPDIIESADPYRLAWAALDAARDLAIPSVAFCHSNLAQMARLVGGPRWGPAAADLARRYAVRLYRRFDLVLAPSAAMARHLQSWGVRQAVHQPLGVDTSLFHPHRRDDRWRDALGLAPGTRLLVFAGRFAPEKNLPTLVAAMQRLGPGYRLVAVGSGPLPPEGDGVTVLPPIRDSARLASLIASGDVFVHAGRQETFGLSVLEALACGVPVVAPACEGLAELVDDSVGRGVNGAAPDDFADAIEDVFTRDTEALRIAARRRAADFDWELVMPLLWSRYRSLLCGISGGAA